ncbi:hypothetical protein Y032_0092g2548 [Ancylostoma ceylanicum]|uniref:Uncharacterized protein n=1 Tax=Ancylostoma ceylanicum TaxID=53326 RepID=A0A016TL18_9BILA|nr:hypothetical protein Y032_0092g2548 [Ancylostoma ceylanicum]
MRLFLTNTFSARSHRLAERSNYTTSYNRPRMVASMVLPLLALLFVFATTLVFIVTISVKMLEHSSTTKYVSKPRLHQVLRIATKAEIRDGDLLEFKYPSCEEEAKVSVGAAFKENVYQRGEVNFQKCTWAAGRRRTSRH